MEGKSDAEQSALNEQNIVVGSRVRTVPGVGADRVGNAAGKRQQGRLRLRLHGVEILPVHGHVE